MEQWVSVFDLPLKAYRGASQLIGSTAEFEIYGPTCDALDHFRRKIPLPESISEGDWIEFGLMGSYGSSTTTRFNGYASERYAIVEKGF